MTDQAEAGFTLIELLVAMVVSLIVLGGGVYGVAYAFRWSTESSARTYASNQAEVRLEVLSRDLRQATPCPANLSLGAGVYLDAANPANQAGLVLSSTTTSTTLRMCDPAPGLPAIAAGSQIPGQALVTWTCTVATEACARTTQNVTGAALTGSVQTTNTLTGVTALSLTGNTVAANATATALSTLATLGTAGATTDYLLGPSSTSAAVSWVGITAQIVSLAVPNSTSNLTQATATAPVMIHTGAALANYTA